MMFPEISSIHWIEFYGNFSNGEGWEGEHSKADDPPTEEKNASDEESRIEVDSDMEVDYKEHETFVPFIHTRLLQYFSFPSHFFVVVHI